MSYHVYGIGNALVDLEYEVSDAQLQALSIDKGVMTLVELDQQKKVIAQLGLEKAKKGSGGSAANSLIALAQLGGSAYYDCRVAQDELGKFYLDDLQAAGVDSNLSESINDEQPTGTCLVMVTPDAERTMNTFLGISASFDHTDINTDAIKNAEYLYTEGYLVTGEASLAAALYAKSIAEENGVKTALSLSDPNMVNFFKSGLLQMIGDGVDILFANEEEAKGMVDADDLETAIEKLKPLAKQLVITLGANGAVIVDADQQIEIAAVETNLVDTNGAGDMFAGTYLYGITQGYSTEAAGKLAAKTAAKLVSEYGARLNKETILAVR